ncbi:MAG TPA: VOC family protein [Steroidobacteraceae bacterium]|jgi:Glyoxalase-like domain|nr:VOC family protein [Steroidobacteraceae bacterium]
MTRITDYPDMMMRAVWLWMLLAGVVGAAGPLVSIGHIPIAVRNLDAASADYRALGFTLKPGHLHDDSVSNNHAKFPDGTELELITASEPRDDIASQYLRLLDSGDGPAFLALEWTDADGVRTALERAGIGFRQGAFFTLDDPRLDYLFFGGDNRSPTDLPEHFLHANGADRLIGVSIADAENPALLKLLRALGAHLDARHTEARLADGGTITLLPRSRRLIADRPLVGAVLLTSDIGRVAAVASKAGIAGLRSSSGPGYRSLVLPPSATHGLWLEFRQLDTGHQ